MFSYISNTITDNPNKYCANRGFSTVQVEFLCDFYPERFYQVGDAKAYIRVEQEKVDINSVLLHIVSNKGKRRKCNAKAYFDEQERTIKILKGSEFCADADFSIKRTAPDFKRNDFLKMNCFAAQDVLVLRRDTVCDSPDDAALFVLGEKVNGWETWKDDKGKSLEKLFFTK